MTITTLSLFRSRSLRALSALLRYPDEALLAALPEIRSALRADPSLSDCTEALDALCVELMSTDALTLQSDYVSWFDQGHATSLHLFEHVHGESRDRGPAMIDLVRTYESGGAYFTADELPDHLPVVLEFASTLSPELARDFLGEMAHLVGAIEVALTSRGSRYGCVLKTVGLLAKNARATGAAEGVAIQEASQGADAEFSKRPTPALDESWEEPPVFGPCNPGQPAIQPIRIVRRQPGVSP